MACGLYNRGAEYSGIVPTDSFDFGRMQVQLEFPDRAVPRWFGHGLSLPPDSGLGLGPAGKTEDKGLGQFGQSTYPAQRKRRAGSRMTTDFDREVEVASEGMQRGTPRKRALFGSGSCGSESPRDDVADTQAGGGGRGRPRTVSHSGLTLPGWGWLIRWLACRGRRRICVQNPCTIILGRRKSRLSTCPGPNLR